MPGVNSTALAQLSASDQKILKTYEKNTLRKIWSAVKKKSLKAAKKESETAYEKLDKIFDKDLGPTLDKFDKEASKFPEIDAQKLQKHKDRADDAIAEYVFDIRAQKLNNKIVQELVGILNETCQELKKRVDFFEAAEKGTAMHRK